MAETQVEPGYRSEILSQNFLGCESKRNFNCRRQNECLPTNGKNHHSNFIYRQLSKGNRV